MKYVFLFLMVIAGFTATALYLPNAYSDFSSNGKYLIDASGYVSGNKTIFDSNIALQITTGTMSGSNMQATLDNGLVTISGAHYLNSGIWQISILRDSKYFVIQGDAQDESGNIIHLNLFGRIVDTNQDGSVFSISGKITGSETLKVSYSAKIISANIVPTKPTTTPTTTTQQPSSATKVSISIVSGASDINNQVHYSPSNIQITPGTTVVWTNNDSVPHRIMSGVAKALVTDQSAAVFTSDGKIDSGSIAPGQSFQYTITSFDTSQSLDPKIAARYNIPQNQTAGDITFFDPTYQFMVGIIAPLSQPTQAKTVQMNIISGASNPNNGQFLAPSSLQITPGTTVVWTNNDSVPHRIMSGQLLSTTESTGGKSSTGKPVSPHFISDNNIDSGDIAPGQHYQFTFTNTGTTQFFDPTYTWVNGIIISSSATTGQITPITISINAGSSLQKGSATQQTYNQYNTYYTPDTIQIVPGTPIIWVNNDSIEHTIFSGTSTQQYATSPFKPDGKIASGKIAPGQTFTVIVNETGIVRFYDPQYTWMNGLIISMPPTQSYTIGASSHNPGLH
ncbi:MAG TPA: plastocyanin/azurin family copper-binding protein [Candidatus Nitrosotalea sp.]|nr:plastocyanin/azurin family copper-binding protein [Candidatus Nitrosotalea sp.]